MLTIIPKPNKIHIKDGKFILGETTMIESNFLLTLLDEYVYEATGLKLDKKAGKNKIRLSLSEELCYLKDEGYWLHVTPTEIRIRAYKENGLFYGVQSLRQLLHTYSEEIPCLEIEDYPKYAYRGFMLDVGRHFFDKEVVKRMIDLCAMQKLNIFHFHLTEDQGWRIEIEKYPLLTKIGSYRKETVIKDKSDQTPVSGYYTKADILEMVAYARERYIKIIPEIDMPGHLRAAIAAYPYLSCEEKDIDVWNRFGIAKEIACAGKESTYTFLMDVLNEVCELFDTDMIHLGGDEVPKEKWIDCPHCQNKIKAEGLKNEEELQAYFINRMNQHLKEKGVKVITWNESLKAGNLDKDIVIQHWMDGKKKKNVVDAINRGRRVIISDYFNQYLDYPYGMTPLTKTYHFDPVFDGVEPDKELHIMGLEAPLWTEYVKDIERMDFMTFPRLTAVAERAWTDEESLDYDDFLQRLECFKKLLDSYGVHYAGKDEVDIKGIKGVIQTMSFFLRAVTIRDIISLFRGV